MTSLVIVGRFPFPGRRLEGMVQRIANIDMQYSNIPRVYLNLYGFRNFKSAEISIGKVSIFTGSFLHFLKIAKILQSANLIYIHSIYFYALVFIPLFFINKRSKLILDIHGVVPEELHYANKKVLSFFMSLIERAAFNRISVAVCVTRKMEKFFFSKYPQSKAKYLYLPIFTAQVCQVANIHDVNNLKKSLLIPENTMIYLYSGGLHAWQNIDKMLEAIKPLIKDERNWFILLTGESDALVGKVLKSFGEVPKQILIKHVNLDELRNYYEMANFGFILRDDHILNHVANPTKLVEYLFFGIYPIVLSPDVGDFMDLGYEYLKVDDIKEDAIGKIKSEVNRKIALKLLEDVRISKISEIINI